MRPDSVYWVGIPLVHAEWLIMLLTKAGDVEENPGTITHINTHFSHNMDL